MLHDRQIVTALIKEKTGMRVCSGPFRGMLITDTTSWGDGDFAPKLLGTYEQEIQSALYDSRRSKYGAIVDVGCAEGYYAVGLAGLFAGNRVYAFDTDPRAIEVAKRNAEINGVSDRIVFGALCQPRTLIELALKFDRLLIVCDCEGGEIDLFGDHGSRDELRDALRASDLVIEAHDFINPRSTSSCVEMLNPTHMISNIYQGGRNPNSFHFLSHLDDNKRMLSVSENRPCVMNWLICRSRSAL